MKGEAEGVWCVQPLEEKIKVEQEVLFLET